MAGLCSRFSRSISWIWLRLNIHGLAQSQTSKAVGFIRSEFWKPLGQLMGFPPSRVRLFEIAFDPVQGALRQPVIDIEVGWLLSLHALRPEACRSGIAPDERVAENE